MHFYPKCRVDISDAVMNLLTIYRLRVNVALVDYLLHPCIRRKREKHPILYSICWLTWLDSSLQIYRLPIIGWYKVPYTDWYQCEHFLPHVNSSLHCFPESSLKQCFTLIRPRGKESTKVRKSQIKGKESENTYQELKRSQKGQAHTNTRKLNWDISTGTAVFLNRKKVNVCEPIRSIF